MSFLVQCILLALFTWIAFIDKYCTQMYTYRPVVAGAIVGLIMGDFSIGLQVGCIIELMFLGQVFVGTALPPEETFSTILAAAFACVSGSTEVALATAIHTHSSCRNFRVDVEGGTLWVSFESSDLKNFDHIFLTGPARKVFFGKTAEIF